MLDFTLVIRVTKKHDFRKKAVVDKVLECIRSRNLHVWFSSPCTGGCSFNLGINWTKSQDNEHTRELILSHWRNHDLMWKGFKRVAHRAHDFGGSISIEWAHRSAFHRLKATRQLVAKYGFEYRSVPGCSVGLMSINPKTKGKLLCKAWGVWSNNPEILNQLSKLGCNKAHPVVGVCGEDTEHSGNYTDRFAKTLHIAFRTSSL